MTKDVLSYFWEKIKALVNTKIGNVNPLNAHYYQGELDDYLDTTDDPYTFGHSTTLATLLGGYWVNVQTVKWNNYISQIAVCSEGHMACRYCYKGTWGEWNRLATSAEINALKTTDE